MIRPSMTSIPLVLALALPACDTEPAAPVADEAQVTEHSAHARGGPDADPAAVNRWLAELRAALAPYHRIDVAQDALWPDEITPCMVEPGTGGMGFHYGDLLRFDGVVEALAPELLLYEPQKNGRMRLVAVEYAVPFSAWPSSSPPELYGRKFHRNEGFGLWVLHAWVWRHNPAGMFKDWNPVVNCDHAP